jgi:glycosyltransferase involved in cell wall biosynthesis
MLLKDWLPRPLRWFLYKAVYLTQVVLSHWIGNVVLVSEHQEERDFKSQRLRKLRIRNFASLDLMNDVADDYLLRRDGVIYVGTQHVNNGSLLLLDIAERTQHVAPGVVFYCPDRFFSPSFKEQFLSEWRKRRLEGTVVILPNVKPHLLVKESLNRATIAISPNLRVTQQVKGAHNKIYEFMAAGLPVVASDLPDQVEVISDSQCGLVARPEEPDSFVDAIVALIRDRHRAQKMGQNGQQAFRERYCWESQMPALQRFYEAILSGEA